MFMNVRECALIMSLVDLSGFRNKRREGCESESATKAVSSYHQGGFICYHNDFTSC